MSSLTNIDLTVCETTRSTIEQAMRVLESTTSSSEDRTSALEDIEEIASSAQEARTAYHFACACHLLAVHSSKSIKERKAFANKCLAEAKKKLSAIKEDAVDSVFKDEYGFTERIFKDLEKKATTVLEAIRVEARQLRSEGKLANSPSPKKLVRHVNKKKKMSQREALELYGDEDYEGDGFDEDDE